VRSRYAEHIAYLKQFDTTQWVIKDYESILQFLETDRTDEVRMFLFKTQRVDVLRKENVFDIFPELEDIR